MFTQRQQLLLPPMLLLLLLSALLHSMATNSVGAQAHGEGMAKIQACGTALNSILYGFCKGKFAGLMTKKRAAREYQALILTASVSVSANVSATVSHSCAPLSVSALQLTSSTMRSSNSSHCWTYWTMARCPIAGPWCLALLERARYLPHGDYIAVSWMSVATSLAPCRRWSSTAWSRRTHIYLADMATI